MPLVSTTTVVTSSKAPSQYEDEVTFTIVVAGALLSSPTGTVQLLDGTSVLATLGLVANGAGSAKTTFALNTLSPGTHSITATYGGDSNFAQSVSNPFLQQVTAVVIPPALLPSFGLIASFSSAGDVTLPPTALLFAIPQSARAGNSITLVWNTTNVASIEITGNNGFDPPFDTGIIATGGFGAYVAGNGFTHTIVLTMQAFDRLGRILSVTGQTTVTIS